MSLIEQLSQALGTDGVLRGSDVTSRQTSFWNSAPLSAHALTRPRSTSEVAQVLSLCNAARVPVVAHGGRTGCALGTLTQCNEIVLSTERMTVIEDIDTIGRTATVQAGCQLQTFQQAVHQAGLVFPLDLGARGSCTVGGNLATNAGGVNVIRYGMAREQVLGLEAVLADGTVVSSMNRMIKNNAGYDLKQLFIGTEGTLGIITRAVFRLREQPPTTVAALLACPGFDSVAALLKAMDRALAGGLSAFELMYGDYYRDVTEPGWHRAPISRDAPFYVVCEAEGMLGLEEQFEAIVVDALEKGLVTDGAIANSIAEREAIFAIRENFEAILDNKPQFLYDIGLPIALMEDYVAEVRAVLVTRWPGARMWVIGHIGDGNLHLFISPGTQCSDLHHEIDSIVYGPLRARGGTISAEHGIGLEKREWLDHSRGPAEIELMRLLKRSMDPQNTLNPGKVLAVT